MYVVKVFGIPSAIDPDAVTELIDPIKFAVASAKTGVSESSVIVFFVPDIVQDGIGEELYAEIFGLEDVLWDVCDRNRAADNVAQALSMFAKAIIFQCTLVHVVLVGSARSSMPVTKYITRR